MEAKDLKLYIRVKDSSELHSTDMDALEIRTNAPIDVELNVRVFHKSDSEDEDWKHQASHLAKLLY